MPRTEGWLNGQMIEVTKRGSAGGVGGPGSIMYVHEADFVFDMTTFKVLKNRYGLYDLTPEEACKALTQSIEQGNTRILLLVD